MTRMLITGGCGFTGREFVKRALVDYEVHVLDNLRSGAYRLARLPLGELDLHAVDMRNVDAVQRVMDAARPRIIVHLAAMHFIPECESSPGEAISVNLQGTATMLDLAPDGCTFVFISSAAVYAPSDTFMAEETTEIGPGDVYGWTKAQGEQFVRYYSDKRRMDALVVRLFNVIGPGETNPHLVPEIVTQMRGDAGSVGIGNLTSKRDYIDVADVAEGLFRLSRYAMSGNLRGCDTVNLGTGKAYSVTDIIDSLKRASGRTFEVITDPARVRKVDRPLLLASTDKLRSLVGWSPATELDETMARLWADPDLPPIRGI